MTNINYLVFIWNVFIDTLLLLIVCAWKMYDMQTLHGGGIPMFRGTYLVYSLNNSYKVSNTCMWVEPYFVYVDNEFVIFNLVTFSNLE